MRWVDIFRLRLRSLFQHGALERELEDEIRFHIDVQIRQDLAAGMTPEQARAAAQREFGNRALHQEECRDARHTGWIENFVEDFRHAIRGLHREPFLACAATATLALAIAATSTVFSIADSILIRPLPYPHADRIDWISEASGPSHDEIAVAPDYYRVREQNRIFEEVGNCWPTMFNWTGVEHPEQLHGAAAPRSFFRVMGTAPLMGRSISRADEGPGKPPVAVLSYDFWRNRLGSDPQILGKTIALDRLPHTIVGVMPQGFDFPHGIQIWVPSDVDEAADREISLVRGIRILLIVARRRPEVTRQQAEAEMGRLSAKIRADYYLVSKATQFRTDLSITAVPLQQHLTGPLRPALLVLTVAVALVLLIACVNVANLLLARAAARQRALAVRLALGSGRGRIARQMLTESLALALPGSLIGVALAWIAVRVLDAAKPAVLVRYPPISMDWRVLAFTFALTLITSLLFGCAPAWFASGIPIQEALKAAGLTHTAGHGAARLRKLLLVGELSVSLILLIGAGLLGRSFLHLVHTDLGFQTDHLLTFQVRPIGPFDRDYTSFYMQLLDRMKRIPGAQSAALMNDMPLSDDTVRATGRFRVEGRPPVPASERPAANMSQVSPEFFRTLEIPLHSGRLFDSGDTTASPIRAVVNEAFVHRVFPGEDPLGRRLIFGLENPETWIIIGVVADVRGGALGADPPSMLYRCTCNGGRLFRAGFAIRTAGDPKAAVRDVEAAVRSMDRDQPIFDVETMDERRDAAMAPPRFQLLLIGTFAALAVLLAVAGIYGVMSYLVSRRTREIGIRVAMGARPSNVVRMVVGESTVLAFYAIVAGLGGAWALTRYLKSMLYGVTALDSVTFTITPLVLVLVVLAASFGPARRAAGIDPLNALKDD